MKLFEFREIRSMRSISPFNLCKAESKSRVPIVDFLQNPFYPEIKVHPISMAHGIPN